MDITHLKNAIQQQLTSVSGVASLQLQNHIYGCFIIMEDIAQKTVELSENQLVGPSYSFDIYEHFSEIGVRYGFVMDTKLILRSVSDAYRDAWLQTFRDLNVLQDIEYSDSTEECIIDLIQKLIPEQDAYFIHALKTGSLPQAWVQKVLALLLSEKSVEEEPVTTTVSAVSKAVTEKPITKVVVKQKPLAHTRRHIVSTSDKKYLAKTRRAIRRQ
jgi:hypothetical protein